MFVELLGSSLNPNHYEYVLSEELQILRANNLLTPEGRESFLENRLTPFVLQVDRLNIEIQNLSRTISSLDPNELTKQEEILAYSKELHSKMEMMSQFLPILESTLLLECDFEVLDDIASKSYPLTLEEKETLKRVASLCKALEKV